MPRFALVAACALAGCVDLAPPAHLSACTPYCPSDAGGASAPDAGLAVEAALAAAAPDRPPDDRPAAVDLRPPSGGPPAAAPDAPPPTPPPDTRPAPPPPDAPPPKPDAPPAAPPDAAPDGPPPATGDPPRFDFERDTQSWKTLRGPLATLAQSGAVAFSGAGALEVGLDFTAVQMDTYVGVIGDAVTAPPVAGTVLTYHVWLPIDHGLTLFQPYVLYAAAGSNSGKFAGVTRYVKDQKGGQWYTVTVTVPQECVRLYEIGVQWSPARAWAGKAYVDAVTW